MKIPTSEITAKANNNSAFVRIEPAYYAPFYRRVWGIRLSDSDLQVNPLPEGADQSARYKEVDSVEAEMRHLKSRFGAEMFYTICPGGERDLREMIEREVQQDINRAKRKASDKSGVPHPTYLEFGLSCLPKPEEVSALDSDEAKKVKTEAKARYDRDCVALAVALQQAGFPTRKSCRGADIMKIVEAGVAPEIALRLIEKIDEVPEVMHVTTASANAK